MKIEFLGTGGAITTPRPGCTCRVCQQARERGVPYSRSGPALFVHGPDLLIDTPEEIGAQLNRAGIQDVRACLYSHWHPDHTMGRRIWEMNHDWRHWPPHNKQTDIYLPYQVAQDFRTKLGLWEHLAYMESLGLVRLIEVGDGETIRLGDVTIRPFRLAEDYVYAFVFSWADRRVLIAPDELFGWQPAPDVCGVDLAILPMGVMEFDPFSGERRIPADHPILGSEATFAQTLDIVRQLNAAQVILTHIEEPDGLSYDDLLVVEGRLQAEGLAIRFAYDTLVVDVG
jgi:phosphoribosyl 1,2-cyclic phosphate phosphodiesterase